MRSISYSIKYSAEAIEDLKVISKYYGQISVSLKNRFKDALLNSERELLLNPSAFSKVNFRDFRRIRLKKFPYKVMYRIENNTIYVFCVLHTARSNRYIKKRLN